MKKRIVVVMLTVMVLLIPLTACGGPKITGVKSLVTANVASQAKVKNFHMDGNIDIDVTLDADELQALLGPVDLKLPVKMTVTADAGKDTAHTVTNASVSVLGKSLDVQTTEMYMDIGNGITYTKVGESKSWKKLEHPDAQPKIKELVGGLAILGKTVLDNAVFSDAEEYYTLSMPAAVAGDLIEDLHLLDHVDLGIADVRDITVKNGQIVYNVDKETLLVSSIELQNVDIRGKGTYEEVSVDLKFPLDAVFTFSRYNELDPSEYAIPEEVSSDR